MSWVATAVVGSALISGIASNSAANTQAKASEKAADAQLQMFEENKDLQEPFRQGGLQAENRLLYLLGLSPVSYLPQGAKAGEEVTTGYGDTSSADFGKYGRDFGMSDFQADPGYAFRLSEGLKALDRQAAARGGLISGSALKAAQRYGQDAASQEYQNAFNRYQVNRSNQLAPLQSLMGASQTATNALGNLGTTTAANAGQAYQNAGSAQASGYVGIGNAINQGIGTYLNYQNANNLAAALQGGGSYGTGGASANYYTDYSGYA